MTRLFGMRALPKETWCAFITHARISVDDWIKVSGVERGFRGRLGELIIRTETDTEREFVCWRGYAHLTGVTCRNERP